MVAGSVPSRKSVIKSALAISQGVVLVVLARLLRAEDMMFALVGAAVAVLAADCASKRFQNSQQD